MTPSTTASDRPPTRDATTGTPLAAASSATSPYDSVSDGITTRADDASRFELHPVEHADEAHVRRDPELDREALQAVEVLAVAPRGLSHDREQRPGRRQGRECPQRELLVLERLHPADDGQDRPITVDSEEGVHAHRLRCARGRELLAVDAGRDDPDPARLRADVVDECRRLGRRDRDDRIRLRREVALAPQPTIGFGSSLGGQSRIRRGSEGVEALHEGDAQLDRHGQGRDAAQPMVGVDDVVGLGAAARELGNGLAELVDHGGEATRRHPAVLPRGERVERDTRCDRALTGEARGPRDEVDLDVARREFERRSEDRDVHAAGVGGARLGVRGGVHRHHRHPLHTVRHTTHCILRSVEPIRPESPNAAVRLMQRWADATVRTPGARRVLLHPVVARPGYWFATAAGLLWGSVLSLGRIRREGGVIVARKCPRWAFGRGGTTIGAVYLTHDMLSPNVLEHEAVHRAQWKKYGLAFIPLYVAAGAVAHTNRFEVEAGLEKGGYA